MAMDPVGVLLANFSPFVSLREVLYAMILSISFNIVVLFLLCCHFVLVSATFFERSRSEVVQPKIVQWESDTVHIELQKLRSDSKKPESVRNGWIKRHDWPYAVATVTNEMPTLL